MQHNIPWPVFDCHLALFSFDKNMALDLAKRTHVARILDTQTGEICKHRGLCQTLVKWLSGTSQVNKNI